MKYIPIILAVIFLIVWVVAKPAGDYKNVSGKEFKAKLDKGEQIQIIDVREPYEFSAGYIKGAVNIPSSNFQKGYSVINKDEEVYLICNSGRRSVTTTKFLLKQGYTKVYNVTGGVSNYPGELVK